MSEFPKIAKARLAASQSGNAGAQHPDADLLNAFAERRLTGQEREGVTAHLAGCPDCREAVSLAVAAAPEGVMADEPVREPMRWAWMRWAIPAASMAIILVAVSLRWQETGGNLEGKRQVDAYVPPPKAAEPAAAAKTSDEESPALMAKKAAAVPQSTSTATPPAASGRERGEIAQGSSGKMLADTRSDAAAGVATRSQNYEFKSAPRASQPGFVAGGAAAQLEREARPAAPPAAVALGAAAPAIAAPEKKDAKIPDNAPALNALTTKSKADQDKLAASSESVEITAPAKPADKQQAKQRKAEAPAEEKIAAGAASGSVTANVNDTFYSAVPVSRGVSNLMYRPILAGSGANLWRGGKTGSLSRSSDGGKTWKQVSMTSSGKTAASDVTALEVSGKNVIVKLSDGSTWTSTDEGTTWKVQAPAPAKK